MEGLLAQLYQQAYEVYLAAIDSLAKADELCDKVSPENTELYERVLLMRAKFENVFTAAWKAADEVDKLLMDVRKMERK